MPTFTNTYSRGNDDPAENSYETAKVRISLVADTSACMQDKSGNCTGEVALSIGYTSTASTADPMFVDLGPNFALRVPGPGGALAQLAHAARPPAGPLGDELTASVPVGTLPCRGGRVSGEVGVEGRIPLVPGGPREWTGFVQQRITYDVSVTSCGNVTVHQLELTELIPMIAIGRIPTPARQTGSSYQPGPFGAGYPAHPGVPR